MKPGGLTIKEYVMAEAIDKQDLSAEDLRKVEETAEKKQLRHRVDEYMSMVIALGAVAILWFLQYLGIY